MVLENSTVDIVGEYKLQMYICVLSVNSWEPNVWHLTADTALCDYFHITRFPEASETIVWCCMCL